jgi:hypothetical protein
MMTAERDASRNRLRYLEQTVQQLNGQLREMQWELRQAKGQSKTERLWKAWMGARPGEIFMSAVCNRRIRPNRKVTDDDRTRPAS